MPAVPMSRPQGRHMPWASCASSPATPTGSSSVIAAGSGAGSDMLRRLNHAWRVVGTGLSFASFGLGGVVLWLVVFPALALFVRDPARRGRLARAVIRSTFGG